MKLTSKNLDRILDMALFCYEHRPVQPQHAVRAGFGSMSSMEHLMPELATTRILERVTGNREDPEDRYAGYIVGAEGRKLLRKHRDIKIGATQSVDVSEHGFFTTDISTELHLALKEDFIYQKAAPFKAKNVHYERREYGLREQVVRKVVEAEIRPDYAFLTPWRLHYIEADNAGQKHKGEPIKRKTLTTQQDIYKKFLLYLGGLLYGNMNFRLLFVTRSAARVMNIIEELYPSLYDQGGFTFQDFVLLNYFDALKNDPFDSWCNLAGQPRSLLRENYHA